MSSFWVTMLLKVVQQNAGCSSHQRGLQGKIPVWLKHAEHEGKGDDSSHQ